MYNTTFLSGPTPKFSIVIFLKISQDQLDSAACFDIYILWDLQDVTWDGSKWDYSEV